MKSLSNILKNSSPLWGRLGGGLLALMLVACSSDDYTDWADPITNPDEPAKTVAMAVSQAPDVDFATVSDELVQAVVINDEIPADEEGVLTNYDATFSANGKSYKTSCTVDGKVAANELQRAVEELYGKRPDKRELDVTIEGYYSIGGQTIKKVGATKLNATLTAPYISKGYWIVGAPSQWSLTCTDLPFTHSDQDVYDDPYFTVTFVVDGECWFAIADDKTHEDAENWKGLLGCAEGNGNNGLEGQIARRTELSDDGSWKIVTDQESTVKMTINMMDYTYKIEIIPMSSFYYVVGGIQGWSDSKRTHLFFPEAEAKTFSYTTKWAGAWDLKVWSKDNFGNWDNAIGCVVDGCADLTGGLIFSGAQAISAPSAEYYTFTINMKDNTYTWTKLDNQTPATYEAIGIIGDFNGWGGDIDLEQVSANNWYAEANIPTDGGLKLRANHDWGMNWGAEMDLSTSNFGQGVGNGPNIYVPAGTYRFYLNDITGQLAIVPVE